MKFSNFCYTGLVNRDFELLYCDEKFIFKRLLMGISKIRRKTNCAKTTETLFKDFKVEGVHYYVQVQRMRDDHLLLRVFRELPPELRSENDICENVNNIKMRTDRSYDTLQMILNFLEQRNYYAAKEYTIRGLSDASVTSFKCFNLVKLFEDSNNASYHQFRRDLIQTCDIIGFAIEKTKKRISFTFDVSPLYAKLDYDQFEMALYNLSKLALIFTCIGSLSFLEISTLGNRFINVFLKIPLQQNLSFVQFRLEMCAVKHIFKNFDGRFDFYEQDGFLFGSGYFETVFTDVIDRVPYKSRLVIRRDFKSLLKRQTSKKFRPIYENEESPDELHSPNDRMEEEWNEKVRNAMYFFEGVDIEREK